ncbi:hypothetical protein D0T87_01360 [Bacteroides sp. 51]|nr:hypothetical protein [Bacteroides sp. 51]
MLFHKYYFKLNKLDRVHAKASLSSYGQRYRELFFEVFVNRAKEGHKSFINRFVYQKYRIYSYFWVS